MKRNVYVALPSDDMNEEDVGKCAKLEFSMYGTWDAAINWHDEYIRQLLENGFEQGRASPCVLYHLHMKIRIYVHGDDYSSSGQEKYLIWMEERLKTKYEIKIKMLGPKQHHEKEVKNIKQNCGVDGWRDQL